MNDLRNKIWYLLVDSKTNEIYSSIIVKKYQIWDLISNIFLALTTSTSVAAWAFWDIYPSLWISIIGISQVIMIVKPFFLFPKYIKVFNEKGIRWQQATLDLEQLWFEFNEGILDNEKAAEKYFKIKRQIVTFSNIPEEIIFFDHNKQLSKAEIQCEIFLKKI